MIKTSLNVPEQVRKNVDKYFAEGHGLANYEPIAVGRTLGNDGYLYVVLGRQIRGSKWAVWTCWNESTQSLNYGHYDMFEDEAMRLFLNTDSLFDKRPVEDRLDEIATKCIHQLLEEDYDDAMEFLRDEIDLSEDECEYFEVDLEDEDF